MNTKVCSKCKRLLSLTEFHRHKRRSETHYSQCKQCKAEYKRKNRSKLLIAQKERRRKDKTLPAKQKAWNKVYYAVKTGKIDKPSHCSICGKQTDRVQAHHEDYNKPFDIVWCCQDCHVVLDKARQKVVSMHDKAYNLCAYSRF